MTVELCSESSNFLNNNNNIKKLELIFIHYLNLSMILFNETFLAKTVRTNLA